MHLPISGIPLYASANTMGPKVLEELFDSTPGPQASDLNAVNCMLRVLLPSLDVNLSILCGGIGGTPITTATTATATALSSLQNEGRSRGGDTVRAKTVASFLLQLFYRSLKRLNGFRLLIFEPGLLEAFSKCLRAMWNKPGAIVEDVPCGKDVLQLIKAILSDIVKHGSPPGCGAFNAVTQILTGGRREQRVMSGSTIKDTEAFDGFRCYVVEFLLDYCRSFDVEVQDQQLSPSNVCEQQVVDERQRWPLEDIRQVLDNLIGASTAAAALLTADDDCCLRVYSSVLELCLSVLNSSLLSPDDGECRNPLIIIVLCVTAVSTLRRATIGVIGNGIGGERDSDNWSGSSNNSSSKLCGGHDHPIHQELGERRSSPPAPAGVDSLLKLLKTIHSNLDVILPLDLFSDGGGQKKHHSLPHYRSVSGCAISSEDQRSENHLRSESLYIKASSPPAITRHRSIHSNVPPTRCATTLYTSKVSR